MARVRTRHALLLGTIAAAVIAQPASAADDAPETPAQTRAPEGDAITPILVETSRPAELSTRAALLSFFVSGPGTVTHRLTYHGRLLGSRTVVCPQGRVWRVRIDFDARAQRRMRRLLGDAREQTIVWEMSVTDPRGNVARRTVDLPV